MTGLGLSGPECRERAGLIQSGLHLDPPVFQRMCMRCGRVTARKDGEGYPWCGGDLEQPQREEGAT